MTNSGNPVLLSVIISVYNRQKGLDILLSDLIYEVTTNKLEQFIEVIVIDDFSKSEVVVPKASFSLTLKRNKANSGAPFSREEGFKLSRGKFLHFHDSDDSFDENWLKTLIDAIKRNPNIDLLLTARIDHDEETKQIRSQKYFDKYEKSPRKIQSRLVYRNCMGPLGGVTFSRRVLEQVEFKNLSSCQDWQMYIEAIRHARVLISRPDIKFIFNKTGDDRISHNSRKKILGHLQLAKITSKDSLFKRNIRLFYLYTCKQHIHKKGGSILKLYKKNKLSIFFTFLVISVYWRIT